MVQYFTIAGRKVASHHIAVGSLCVYFGLPTLYFKMRPSKPVPAAPPINASSPDEESFVKQFMEQAEAKENQ